MYLASALKHMRIHDQQSSDFSNVKLSMKRDALEHINSSSLARRDNHCLFSEDSDLVSAAEIIKGMFGLPCIFWWNSIVDINI